MEYLCCTPVADGLMALVWLAANGLLGTAAWQLSRRLYPQEACPQILLHSLVLCWACVVATATVLGMVGMLGGWSLLASVASVSAATLWGLRIADCGLRIERRSAIRNPQSAIRNRGNAWLEHWWVAVWCLLALFALGHVIRDSLLRFPSDWDSLMYHIPLVVQWLHAGSLYAPDCSHWGNPGNNELVGLWMVAPFSGDFLIGLNNVPATLLLALASLELGRTLGLTRSVGHLAALAVVCNYVVVYQLADAENDVAVCSLFLTCLLYSLRWLSQARPADLVLGSVSLGLLLGVKYYAVGYALVVWGVLIPLATYRRGLRCGLGTALLTAVGAVLWGGYWYARNLVVSGTPFYPKGLIEGSDALAQMYGAVWRSSLLGCGQVEVWPLAVTAVWRLMGPASLVALLSVPFVVAGLLLQGLRGDWSRHPQALTRLALGILVLAAGAVLLITPFAIEDEPGTLNQLKHGYAPVRYGLCFLSLSVLSLALVLQDSGRVLLNVAPHVLAGGYEVMSRGRDGRAAPSSGRGWPRARAPVWVFGLHALLGTGIVVFLLASCWYEEKRRYWVEIVDIASIGVLFLSLGLILYGCWVCWPQRRRRIILGTSCLLVAGIGVSCACLAEHWHQGFGRYYEWLVGTSIVTDLAEMRDATLRVCVLDNRSYPYMGSRRDIRVCQPLWGPSDRWLINYLEKHKATLVVNRALARDEESVTGRKYYWGFERLLREQPQVFVPVHEGAVVSLFRIQRHASGDGHTLSRGLLHGEQSGWTVEAEESR